MVDYFLSPYPPQQQKEEFEIHDLPKWKEKFIFKKQNLPPCMQKGESTERAYFSLR